MVPLTVPEGAGRALHLVNAGDQLHVTLEIHIWKVDSILEILEGTHGLATLRKGSAEPECVMTKNNIMTWPSPHHVTHP